MSCSPKYPGVRTMRDGIPKYLNDAEFTKPIRNNPSRVRPVWRAIKTARCLYLSDNHEKNIMLIA